MYCFIGCISNMVVIIYYISSIGGPPSSAYEKNTSEISIVLKLNAPA